MEASVTSDRRSSRGHGRARTPVRRHQLRLPRLRRLGDPDGDGHRLRADIGAIVVIAVFYSSSVEPLALLAAACLLGAMGTLRATHVYWMPAYVVLGSMVWLAVFESGVHATIAASSSDSWLPLAR